MTERSTVEVVEDMVCLMSGRIIMKWKKGMISDDEMSLFEPRTILVTYSSKDDRKLFDEILNSEMAKAAELMSSQSCSRCSGSGILKKAGDVIQICTCINLSSYRGDEVLPKDKVMMNDWIDKIADHEMIKNVAVVLKNHLLPNWRG